MTPAPQQAPKEYIITEERLVGLQAIYGIAQEIIDEVMLRPYPAPALNEDTWNPAIHGYCGDVQRAIQEQRNRIGQKLINGKCIPDGDCAKCILCDNAGGCLVESSFQVTAAARQAREDVLNELSECFLSDSIIYEGSFIHKTIESLRSTQHPGQVNVDNCTGKFNPKIDPCYHCSAVEVCPYENPGQENQEIISCSGSLNESAVTCPHCKNGSLARKRYG